MVDVVPYGFKITVLQIARQQMSFARPTGTGNPDNRFIATGIERIEKALTRVVPCDIRFCNFCYDLPRPQCYPQIDPAELNFFKCLLLLFADPEPATCIYKYRFKILNSKNI